MRDLQARIDELTKVLQRKELFIQRLSDGLAPLRNKIQHLTNERAKEIAAQNESTTK